jgi:GNAT superfamily N-acetyltransferase
VDVLGLAQPTLQRSGDARTIVELSAVTDPDEAVAVIGRTAQLTFHPVESAAEAADIGEAASGELVSGQDGAALPDDARMPLQLGPPALAGDAVGTAGMATGPTGGFDVTVDFRGAIVLTPPSATPPDRAFLRQAEDALLGEVYGRPVTGDEAPRWPAAGEPAPRTWRSCPATSCRPRRSAACRELLDAPFGDDLDNTDSEHALGGWLVLVHEGGVLVAHTAVVPRHPDLVRHRFQAGYVEAVATRPHRQGHGFGSAAMVRLESVLRERFEFGALSTPGRLRSTNGSAGSAGGAHLRPRGRPPAAHDGRGRRDPGAPLGRSAAVRLDARLSCETRPGDAW